MYVLAEDLRSAIKDDMLDGLLGGYIEDEAAREAALLPLMQEAIEDACAEIDGYLNKRYPVPLNPVPRVVTKFAKDMALFNLMSRMGIDEGERENVVQTRYKNAVRFFEGVARGLMEIGVKLPSQEATTGFKMEGPPRLFSRDSLKGM